MTSISSSTDFFTITPRKDLETLLLFHFAVDQIKVSIALSKEVTSNEIFKNPCPWRICIHPTEGGKYILRPRTDDAAQNWNGWRQWLAFIVELLRDTSFVNGKINVSEFGAVEPIWFHDSKVDNEPKIEEEVPPPSIVLPPSPKRKQLADPTSTMEQRKIEPKRLHCDQKQQTDVLAKLLSNPF